MSSLFCFSLRDATLARDEAFIISVFDASIPYLSSLGSEAQWGTSPFSSRPGWLSETQTQIRESEQNAAANTTNALRILILEVVTTAEEMKVLSTEDVCQREQDDARRRMPVAFAFVRGNWLPSYLPAAAVDQAGQSARDESLYVEVMVSAGNCKDRPQGIGAAMLRELRVWGRCRGKKILYLDGWAGNDRELIRYYTQQGLQTIAEFNLPRKNKDPWLGTLMKLDI
ncbi:hypothetical protein E8E13_001285 [Curvularia kusanoi]|uniref:N-acetyltransferase domain-containing protein n=1 Tax=Curvularia kusanoi TaxID=90978 RepID=A0A9P4T342_CURKU|nr:hypothetical protein E8E13_001285 [Curvularia kusanoi]